MNNSSEKINLTMDPKNDKIKKKKLILKLVKKSTVIKKDISETKSNLK